MIVLYFGISFIYNSGTRFQRPRVHFRDTSPDVRIEEWILKYFVQSPLHHRFIKENERSSRVCRNVDPFCVFVYWLVLRLSAVWPTIFTSSFKKSNSPQKRSTLIGILSKLYHTLARFPSSEHDPRIIRHLDTLFLSSFTSAFLLLASRGKPQLLFFLLLKEKWTPYNLFFSLRQETVLSNSLNPFSRQELANPLRPVPCLAIDRFSNYNNLQVGWKTNEPVYTISSGLNIRELLKSLIANGTTDACTSSLSIELESYRYHEYTLQLPVYRASKVL